MLRERDPIAGPCLVLPGPFQRFAERRRSALAGRTSFEWLVARLRSGPPAGFFRLGWVRSVPSLNEYFVHHEDLRRANGLGPGDALPPALEAALRRNARLGGRYLSRRLRGAGLEIVWAGTDAKRTVRRGSAAPGELLLFVFGRPAARVAVTGKAEAIGAVRRTHFGM